MNNEKEVTKCDRAEEVEVQKVNVETEEPKPSSSLPVPIVSGFNTEEFLARVSMNEKINNILRSPTKTTMGVRQRTVFTSVSRNCVHANPSQLIVGIH